MRIDLRRRASRLAALAALALICAPSISSAAELGADLDSLLAYARAQSPELAAMRHEAEAAAERIQPAGALPDPVLRVELENLGNDTGAAREARYTLMQGFPLGGKRGLRRDAASADAQQAQARADAAWSELAAKLKTGFAQYFAAAGSERLVREQVELLARLEQTARQRYAAGLGSQQDAIRAQLEQTAMRAELIALANETQQARVRLNALLARDAAAPLAEPGAPRPLPAVNVYDAATLAQRARSANPLLAAEAARLRAAQSNRELASRNHIPDLQLGLAPVQMGSRIASWGVMVELNIPLQRETRRSQQREADAMANAQRARADALASQLLGELGEQLSALDAARRTEALITDELLPQTELALRSALAAYEAGKAEFAMLLDTERQIRKARQDRLKAQADAQMRVAEIERIVGEEL
ncbi:TolC family protein [Ideonella sp.]|uniref:TolC family protein n=1 Tax=Ideonella sp. TaxID=1929293 RepID=UPI002B48B014|nr:TolC family protein [Ideonella sp.]HJV70108.1 TolC family protein [Ideonella sp.]